MRSSARLDEARLLGQEAFPKKAKCWISKTDVKNDETLNVITHLEFLMTQQHLSSITYEKCISLHETTLRQVRHLIYTL